MPERPAAAGRSSVRLRYSPQKNLRNQRQFLYSFRCQSVPLQREGRRFDSDILHKKIYETKDSFYAVLNARASRCNGKVVGSTPIFSTKKSTKPKTVFMQF